MASVLQQGLSALSFVAPAALRDSAAARTSPSVTVQPGLGIRIEGLEKRFGDRIVLRRTDLAIEAGQFVAVVGRSGSGKSTLLRAIAGLETPEAGHVRLGGQTPQAASGSVRIMFQDGRLLPWRRVIDNVTLGLSSDARGRGESALHSVGLLDRAREWPRVLSGGQRQRVALARALAARPRLILLDEPLGALDALTRIEMQDLIEDLWRQHGFTAVLVTHDVAEAARLADRILLIEDGAIALDLAVDLPRPRRTGADLAAVEAVVLGRILGKPAG